jgi:hypothetical protein
MPSRDQRSGSSGEVDVPEDVPAADPLQVQAADPFAEQLTRVQVLTVRGLRSALRVGQPRAQQLHAHLAKLADVK